MESKQLQLFDVNDDFNFYFLIHDNFLPEENFEIEYKSGLNGFPKELWKTYSAFANTNTGFIIIGVKEQKSGFIIEGLSDEQIESYKREFWNNCNNPNTVSRNLLTNNDVKVVAFNNKNLLVIRVPFASRTERPVFLTRNPFGNTYKRNHEGDYRCTDDEIKRMLADSSSELRRDNLILEGFDMTDLDPVSIRQFRQLFAASNSTHPWLALEDLDLLIKLGVYRIDRNSKKKGITLAGLLMFGKDNSLREQDVIPNYFPDFRARLSIDKDIRWSDRIYPDGTWECNLLQFFLRVWPKLIATLPKPFKLDEDTRIDEAPTHIALREAFVNSLVHTDYSLNGNIIVELESDKFVFSNPGSLLVSLQQYYAGGISECRNPSLQLMFMLIGRAEKAGSGVDKIMTGWPTPLWRRPFVELESQPDRVKLTLPMFSIIPDDVLGELEDRFENLKELTPDELTVLSFASIEGTISNQRLQYVLDVHRVDISTLLKDLCERKFLESENKGRWTTYKLPPKVATYDPKVATHDSKVATLSQDIGGHEVSTHKVDSSKAKVDSSAPKVDSSTPKVDSSTPKVDSSNKEIPLQLKRDELESLIMTVCRDRYMKLEDIAIQINRSVDYLKNKIFPKMIREGKLEKKYPYTHTHPEQAYKTKISD